MTEVPSDVDNRAVPLPGGDDSGLKRPTAIVTIQRRGEISEDGKNALIIRSPPFYMEGKVSYAVAEDSAALGTLDVEIYNLGDDIIGQLDPNGLIKVEAGYENDDLPKPQAIFFGVLNYAIPITKGVERVWSIHATTVASRFSLVVPYSVRTAFIGDIVQTLARSIGAEVRMPPIAFTEVARVDDFTATASVEEEITQLVRRLSDVTGISYLIRSRLEQPHSWDVVSATSEEDNLVLLIDEDLQTVYNSAPSPMQGEARIDAQLPAGIEAPLQAADADGNITSFEHHMTLALDPRLSIGMWVNAVRSKPDPDDANSRVIIRSTLFFLKALTIGFGGDEWMTDIKGPIIGADILTSGGA